MPQADSISVGPARRKAAEAAWSALVLRVELAQLRAEWLRAEWLRVERLRVERHCRMAQMERRARSAALPARKA